jgi:hypothetical protein
MDTWDAYDNAVYRWNHCEFEPADATFESILYQELSKSGENES